MALGMLLPPIARGIIECRRRRLPAERPVIPDVGPDAAHVGLAPCQDRHGGIIAMQAISSKHMRLDQRMKWLQRCSTRANLVGERREAQFYALAAKRSLWRFSG